jgi:hypothetical protein
MRPMLMLSACFLGGCVTASEVRLADGSMGHNIQCGGTARNFSHCLERAGEICGARGYQVVTREGDTVPFGIAGGSATGQQAGFYAHSGAIASRNLFVKCKQ